MIIALLASEEIRKEMEEKPAHASAKFIWADSLRSLLMIDAEAYFDLQFSPSAERIAGLKQLNPKPVFISSVDIPARQIDPSFCRLNTWPGMIGRKTVELACGKTADLVLVESVMQALGWKYQIVPDIEGFITCRVIALIINEAYFTWQAGVSTREEIDIAMKYGTNYPYGPFEWADKIGKEKILSLLTEMARLNPAYIPAAALVKDSTQEPQIN